MLSVCLADDGKCDPWTDVIADEVATQSTLESQPKGPGTHEFLSQHLPDVHTNPLSGANTTAATPDALQSPLNGVSHPATSTAASPATHVTASPSSPLQQQPLATATHRPAVPPISIPATPDSSKIRTPPRAGSAYSLSQAAQQAESSRSAVEKLVAGAVAAVKRAHQEADAPNTDAAGIAAAAEEHARQQHGHGPFLGVPLEPVAGAYSIAILVRYS